MISSFYMLLRSRSRGPLAKKIKIMLPVDLVYAKSTNFCNPFYPTHLAVSTVLLGIMARLGLLYQIKSYAIFI